MTSTNLRALKRRGRCASTSNSQAEGLLWPLTLRPFMKGNAGKCNSSSAALLLPIHPRAPHCAAAGSSFMSSVEWASITIIIDTSIHPPFFLKTTPWCLSRTIPCPIIHSGVSRAEACDLGLANQCLGCPSHRIGRQRPGLNGQIRVKESWDWRKGYQKETFLLFLARPQLDWENVRIAAAMKGESVWASRQHRAKIWQERKGSKDIVSFDETVLEGSFTPTFQLWGTINSLFVSPVWVGFSVIFNQNSPSWLTQWSKAKVSDSWNCSSETLYARDQSGEDSPTLVLLSQSRSLSSTEVWMN